MASYRDQALKMHEENRGKVAVSSKVTLKSLDDLSAAYTPGVAAPCLAIADDPSLAYKMTCKANTVAVVSDGSAVLGLGNIGPLGALPVMEGKAILFKEFGGIDAWPIVLDTQDPDEIVRVVRAIAPGFGGINLEDISAPRCFTILEQLQDLGIPVFHDDQHGTAIATLAALINAARVVGKPLNTLKVVISGAGAAGIATAKMLADQDVADVILVDSKGIISSERSDLTPMKVEALTYTNRDNLCGNVKAAIKGADVFVGVSKGGLLNRDDIRTMAKDAIVFAMANPDPEILPDEAKAGGAAVVATGRSDFANQVNNVLVFPGVFRGAFNAGAGQITPEMRTAAAFALADVVKDPTPDKIIPGVFEVGVADRVAEAVAKNAPCHVQAGSV